MSSGGGGTNTVETQSGPPQQFLDAYSNITNQAAFQVAANPTYQPYNGNLVAGFSPQQIQGINATVGDVGLANPYIAQAGADITNSTAPLWAETQQFSPGAVSQYESPYTQQVVQATENQFNNQNAQQQTQLAGNAISNGAFGGDRASVAAGVLGGQQQLAEAPTIAGLENQGYSQALGEFNTQQQAQLGANEANAWLSSQAGYGMANLGNEALNTNLQGANALLGVGGLEQQLNQENLNVPYENYIAQQSYPFQTLGWEANIDAGLGGSAGGKGSTTYPGPSPLSQAVGGAATGIGLLGSTGAFGSGGYLTGAGGLFGAGAGAVDTGAFDVAATAAATDAAAGAGAAGAGEGLIAAAAKRGGAIPPGGLADAIHWHGPIERRDDGGALGEMDDEGDEGGLGTFATTSEPVMNNVGMRRVGDDATPPPPTGSADQSGLGALAPAHARHGSTSDPWSALLYTGLGIMGGSSPNAAENIGRGALEGLKLYETNQERRAQTEALADYRQTQGEVAQARIKEEGRRTDINAQAAAARLAAQLKHQQVTEQQGNERIGIEGGNLGERARHDREVETQGHYTWAPGQGPGTDGNQTNGSWRYSTKGDEAPQFFPGVTQQRTTDAGNRQNNAQTRIQNTEEYRQHELDLRNRGLGDNETANIMNNASRMVQNDPTGKTTLQSAVQDQMKQRGAAGAARETAPARPVIPTMPQGLPAGSQYSPSRQMWRDPAGVIYNNQGQRVQ